MSLVVHRGRRALDLDEAACAVMGVLRQMRPAVAPQDGAKPVQQIVHAAAAPVVIGAEGVAHGTDNPVEPGAVVIDAAGRRHVEGVPDLERVRSLFCVVVDGAGVFLPNGCDAAEAVAMVVDLVFDIGLVIRVGGILAVAGDVFQRSGKGDLLLCRGRQKGSSKK